jgi:hypothetical protein
MEAWYELWGILRSYFQGILLTVLVGMNAPTPLCLLENIRL